MPIIAAVMNCTRQYTNALAMPNPPRTERSGTRGEKPRARVREIEQRGRTRRRLARSRVGEDRATRDASGRARSSRVERARARRARRIGGRRAPVPPQVARRGAARRARERATSTSRDSRARASGVRATATAACDADNDPGNWPIRRPAETPSKFTLDASSASPRLLSPQPRASVPPRGEVRPDPLARVLRRFRWTAPSRRCRSATPRSRGPGPVEVRQDLGGFDGVDGTARWVWPGALRAAEWLCDRGPEWIRGEARRRARRGHGHARNRRRASRRRVRRPHGRPL